MNDHVDTTATPSKNPLLSGRNLRKEYVDGKVTALQGVDVNIDRGEYVAIVGPSGSGKSTLLTILGCLDLPDSGEVLFENQSIDQHSNLDQIRQEKIGFVFQSFCLIPTLSALENIMLPMAGNGRRQNQKRARRLLSQMGLESRARHLPTMLSSGERQRVAIARALANDPAILLADEPTGNLDSVNAAAIMDLFENIRDDSGVSLVIVTHDREIAGRAERIVALRDGKIEQDASQPISAT